MSDRKVVGGAAGRLNEHLTRTTNTLIIIKNVFAQGSRNHNICIVHIYIASLHRRDTRKNIVLSD